MCACIHDSVLRLGTVNLVAYIKDIPIQVYGREDDDQVLSAIVMGTNIAKEPHFPPLDSTLNRQGRKQMTACLPFFSQLVVQLARCHGSYYCIMLSDWPRQLSLHCRDWLDFICVWDLWFWSWSLRLLLTRIAILMQSAWLAIVMKKCDADIDNLLLNRSSIDFVMCD